MSSQTIQSGKSVRIHQALLNLLPSDEVSDLNRYRCHTEPPSPHYVMLGSTNLQQMLEILTTRLTVNESKDLNTLVTAYHIELTNKRRYLNERINNA